MLEDVDAVEGHGGGGVAAPGLVGFAHAPIVEDEDGVLGTVVAEVFGLALPGGFDAGEAHYELSWILACLRTQGEMWWDGRRWEEKRRTAILMGPSP